MAKKGDTKDLLEELLEKGDKISKARKMKMLITLQDSLIKKKQKMVDFQEPVLFFTRRDGRLEFYDRVTQGKFLYKHSSGEERWLEIRPQDQLKFEYGDKRVRCYLGHEDRPFTGFDNPILDTEGIALAMNKIKATNQKYEEALLREKNKGLGAKAKVWIWAALAIAIVGFAVATWVLPAISKSKADAAARTIGGMAFFMIRIKGESIFNTLRNKCKHLKCLMH